MERVLKKDRTVKIYNTKQKGITIVLRKENTERSMQNKNKDAKVTKATQNQKYIEVKKRTSK